MHQRHQDERLQLDSDLLVVPARDGRLRQGQSQGIGGEHVTGIAEGIPGELVQQDHECQRPFGSVHPGIKLAAGRCEVRFGESVLEVDVERLVLGEPFLGTGFDPESDNVSYGRQGRGHGVHQGTIA